MERNIDTLGFYHIDRTTSPATETFVRWNSNNPATMRQIVSAKHDVQYMASDTITIEVESVAPINGIEVGDYITLGGAKFRLNQSQDPTKTEEKRFKYTFTFESVKYELIDALFFLVDGNGNPISEIVRDDFTGTMLEFLKLIVNNANRVYPNQWQLPLNTLGQWAGTATLPADAKTLSFDGQNCLNVLQNLCETWNEGTGNLEYKITESGGVKTIDIIERDKAVDYIDNAGQPFRYGCGNGLYQIERKATSAEKIITKLYAFGGKDNLPARYFATRLGLAKARGTGTVGNKADSYIDRYTEGGQTIIPSNKYGVREGVLKLDEIKPHATWHVSSVGTITTGSDFYIYIAQGTGEPTMFDLNAQWSNNNSDYQEYLKLNNLQDNNNVATSYTNNVVGQYKYIATGETIAVTFNSGDLAGLEFYVEANGSALDYNHGLLRLRLRPRDEENAFDPATGTTIAHRYTPNATIQPKAGDAFVFTGIQLPWNYVQAAETQLAAAALEKYKELSQPQATYAVKLANDFINETYPNHNIDILECGKYLHIADTDLGINHKIRITQYSRDLMKGYEYEVTISDFEPKRKTNDLTVAERQSNATNATQQNGSVGGSSTPEEGTTLDMEFTCAGNSSKLRFYCIDNTMQSGVLRDRRTGKIWTIANGDLTIQTSMSRNPEYKIYISLNGGVPSTGSVYVRESWLSSQAREKGKLVDLGNSFLVWAGTIKPLAFSTEATQAYREVEMYIGKARNEAIDFVGGSLHDSDGKIEINFISGQQSFKIASGSTFVSSPHGLVFDQYELKAKKLKAYSEGDAVVVPCIRGDFIPAQTYNEGDIVRVPLDSQNQNFAIYRCLVDGVQQNTEPTSTDANWMALSTTTAGGGGGSGVQITVTSHTMNITTTGTQIYVNVHTLIINV